MKNILTKVFGTKHEREIKKLNPFVDEINEHFESYASLSEEELQAKTEEFRKRLADGESLDDIMCEAFAVVNMAVNKILNLNLDKVNVNGGAIALGHPIGASGARILVTLIHEMKNRNSEFGLASLCIGGGEASALIVRNYN